MKILLYLLLPTFIACNRFDEKVVQDIRFSGGREYETGKPIKPQIITVDKYTFIFGYSAKSGRASCGLYLGNKEIFYNEGSDGFFDKVMTANLNNDGIQDFLISFVYEDGAELYGLTSKSETKFSQRLLIEECYNTYCAESDDTLRHLLPLQIKDINNDHKDDIIANLVSINGKVFAISCTDTAYGE